MPFNSLNWPLSGFSGTLTSTVVAGDPSNFLGGLTFEYEITSSPASMSSIERATVNGFAGFLTDVSWDAASVGDDPNDFTRSAGTGDTVGFDLQAPPLAPGQMTAILVVRTNAPLFANNTLQMIDGDIAQAPTFAPVPNSGSGTPEPASLALLGLGVSGLAWRRRRS